MVQIQDLIQIESSLRGRALSSIDYQEMKLLKRRGFADERIAGLLKDTEESSVQEYRHELGVRPVYKRVDTCAAEFESSTAYLYSTYEEECEALPTGKEKIMVLGGGPNRIGQGIKL